VPKLLDSPFKVPKWLLLLCPFWVDVVVVVVAAAVATEKLANVDPAVELEEGDITLRRSLLAESGETPFTSVPWLLLLLA